MSWLQGIQERETLPEPLVALLDSKSEGLVECISWYPENTGEFAVHYYKDGEFLEAKLFRYST